MQRAHPILAALAFATLLPSCGGGVFGSLFNDLDVVAVETDYSAVEGGPVAAGVPWLVYYADEASSGAGGTDLNGDGDFVDEVVVVSNSENGDTFVTGAIAREFFLVRETIYLLVEESADALDWNTDGDQDDLVLVHWDVVEGLRYVDDVLEPTLGPAGVVANRDRLYYSSPIEPVGADTTNLRYLDREAPLVPFEVLGELDGGTLRPYVIGQDEDLVFLGVDETVEGADFNGDGDSDDTGVLALLDGLAEVASVRVVGLALDPANPVFGTRRTGSNDWSIAFLVNEAAQGETNFNDPALFDAAWNPGHCGTPDDDTDDDVLFQLDFQDWIAEVDEPLNTGLAGRDRAVVVLNHVATLSDEAGAGCDLNLDGDLDDVVARWASDSAPVTVNATPEELLAIAELPGGAQGLAVVNDAFVITVDEVADQRDHNDDGEVADVFIAWTDPDVLTEWVFQHLDPDGQGLYVSPDWFSPVNDLGRLPATFLESVQGQSLNSNCGLAPVDDDEVDVLPVWVRVATSGFMVVPGVGFAAPASGPGTVLAAGSAYFRVSEAGDGVDHNLDGDLDDTVLFRNSLVECNPDFVGTCADLPGPAIFVDVNETAGAGFYAFEIDEGVDYNSDGDTDDFVLRVFNL